MRCPRCLLPPWQRASGKAEARWEAAQGSPCSVLLQGIPYPFNNGSDYLAWRDLVSTGQLTAVVRDLPPVSTACTLRHAASALRHAVGGTKLGRPRRDSGAPRPAFGQQRAAALRPQHAAPSTPHSPGLRPPPHSPQLLWLASNAPLCDVAVLDQEIEPFDYGTACCRAGHKPAWPRQPHLCSCVSSVPAASLPSHLLLVLEKLPAAPLPASPPQVGFRACRSPASRWLALQALLFT
jgi:hypothetical protein